MQNNEIQKRIFKVWRVFINDRNITLSVSYKNQDGSYTKGLATIWKTKKDGSESIAFKNFKALQQPLDNKLFKIDYKDYGTYKNEPTYTVIKIEEFVNTKQQSAPALNNNVFVSTPKTTQEPKDVPWENIQF